MDAASRDDPSFPLAKKLGNSNSGRKQLSGKGTAA